MTALTAASLGAWLIVTGTAVALRGAAFGTYSALAAGLYTYAALAIAPLVRATPVGPGFLALHGLAYFYLFLFLARPRMRGLAYRALVALPGAYFLAGTLRRICEDAVAADPDLILLTGDFLTMDSQESEDYLTQALAPLRPLSGRTFACRGNHDLEAPAGVAEALRKSGVRLLIDESATASTPYGEVDLIGFDFVFHAMSITCTPSRSSSARRLKTTAGHAPRAHADPHVAPPCRASAVADFPLSTSARLAAKPGPPSKNPEHPAPRMTRR